MKERIEEKGLWLWVVAAMAAPFGQWLGSAPWLWVMGASLAVGILFLGARKLTGEAEPGKLLASLQLLFLIIIVGVTASHTGDCWLTAKVQWIIPATLLVLAACAASGGNAVGQRAGATLFWFVALGFGVLLLFALPDVCLPYLRPAQGKITVLPVLLLPGVCLLLPRKKGKTPWALPLVITGLAGLISGITAGVLSPGVAARTSGAFMEMVRGIRVMEAAERLEAVAAAVMTLSWFCVLSLLLSAAGHMGEQIFPGKRKFFVWFTAGLGGGLSIFSEEISASILGLAAVILWYILPAAKHLRKRRH